MLDEFLQHIDGHRIGSALRNNQVSISFGGFNVEVVHGFDDGLISVDEVFDGTSTLHHIAAKHAYESLITVGIDKDLHVEDGTNRRIDQGHDAFEDDDRTRLDAHGLGETRTGCVIIYRLVDSSALTQEGEVLVEQLPVERTRLIKVLSTTLLRTTVVFPDPVPPAIPMIMLLYFWGKFTKYL